MTDSAHVHATSAPFRPDDRLLSADEAAELLGVSAYTVRQWARERRIPYVPLGRKLKRFRLSSLLAWMAERERQAR